MRLSCLTQGLIGVAVACTLELAWVAEAADRFGERGFIEVLDARFEQQTALIAIEQLRAAEFLEQKR